MGLQKGKTNNPDGRPKGAKGKATAEAKEVLNSILFSQFDNVKKALERLQQADPKGYLDVMSKLLAYALPRKTDLTSDEGAIPPALNITVATNESKKRLEAFLNNGTATN